jgi:hypothetical protein
VAVAKAKKGGRLVLRAKFLKKRINTSDFQIYSSSHDFP